MLVQKSVTAYKLQETYLIELERRKCIRYPHTEFGINFYESTVTLILVKHSLLMTLIVSMRILRA